MRFSLAPREERFFDMFNESVDVVLEGVRLFNDMIQDFTNLEEKAKKIKEVELRGDQFTHRMVEALNRSFVTPIDRDDIYALNSGLDDILDYAEALASRMVLFKIKETNSRDAPVRRAAPEGNGTDRPGRPLPSPPGKSHGLSARRSSGWRTSAMT